MIYAAAALVVGLIALLVMGAIGYVLNLVALAALLATWGGNFTAEIILRLLGIIPPIGALLGWAL